MSLKSHLTRSVFLGDTIHVLDECEELQRRAEAWEEPEIAEDFKKAYEALMRARVNLEEREVTV